MAAYDTVENGRSELTEKTLDSLLQTVDFDRHEIILVSNASCERTERAFMNFQYKAGENCQVIFLPENLGTAKAINTGWIRRKDGQHCIKIDNDVVIHSKGWVDELEEAINRMPQIGIIGLKRKDLIECTTFPDPNFRSTMVQLPHEAGQKWIQIEVVKGVMGTCKMINAALLDKIGYLCQPTVYGFDDSLYSCRSTLAGFINCFLPHIEIDHIDPGGTDYTVWKQEHAGETAKLAHQLANDYVNGVRPIYENA